MTKSGLAGWCRSEVKQEANTKVIMRVQGLLFIVKAANHSLSSTVSEIKTSGKMWACGTWHNVYECISKVCTALSLTYSILALILFLLANPSAF